MGASIASWAVILRKRSLIRRARTDADAFEGSFWSGGDLSMLFRSIEAPRRQHQRHGEHFRVGIPGVRTAAPAERRGAPAQLLEGAQRAMRVAQMREVDRLEHNLAMLATIGSTSPYVGLFGTVWGIMNSFHSLGNVQQATLAMVAPGIAEALIATAMGLFAAIPAVIAYNRYADQVGRLELRYDTFMEEFATILQRHAAARAV